jgi:predicted SnoaL-like aldol condensation-catalyzing enzyme
MAQTTEEQNKTLVLAAFDAAFNQRDTQAFERYWSPDYVQHSAHIPPGRDGLAGLIASMPADMKYEHQLAVANGEYVMIHGRFSNIGLPKAWVVVDIVRVADGRLAEHWDVIQDEATEAESKSGQPMFGQTFSAV